MIFAAAATLSWNLTAAQIRTNCAAQIAIAKTRAAQIASLRGPKTFTTVVLPLENLSADLSDRTVAEGFLFSVAASKDVRDASEQCGNDESAFSNDLQANPKIYAALLAAQRGGTAKNPYDRKTLWFWLDAFKRSGAGLPAAKRTAFVTLSNQLTNLQNRYGANLSNDATTISITPAQASSLPADFVAGFQKTASGYTVPVDESTYARFMQNEKDGSARQAFYMAFFNRQAGPNTQLLEQAIAIRDRLAHIMGYQTWAAYQLSDRMAQNPQRVMKFLEDLDARAMPQARIDVDRLSALKAKDTGDPHATLLAWDSTYYANVLRKTQYSVDNNEIRQYFPVQHTIDSVLQIYHTLLGVDFKQVVPADAWAPDVLEYSVSDSKTGKFIGTTYFDLYPRPGKYTHFANFSVLPARRLADGTMRPPMAVIVGNWPKPAAGNPALLSHADVVTFFHEFGHNLATLLATAPYETLSQPFIQDFVEAPSQMLENFVWQPSILKQISSNYKTGEPLPDSLIAAMTRARYLNFAYSTTADVALSEIDMVYHTSGPHLDTTSVWDREWARLTPVPSAPGTHEQAGFTHLMAGYDAGYYGYLWSEVYAKDLFTAFQNGGLENPEVGMRYRQDILEPSRTYDPDVEVKRFLGRPMSPEAYYEQFAKEQAQ
ncbi:MAG TPA: M3 family metallopeptidase [Candidatus Baltobacteraceae bacterium]|jgi:thimet oligopeptidase|nr:M3 family metallopeptidase [Candidatus Baltobacteraceae bacterium]